MRLSPFFRHCETVQISPFFSETFLLFQRVPLQFFDILQQNGFSKIPKGSPFYIFRHYATYQRLKKIEKKFGKICSLKFSFLRDFVASRCRKSGFRVAQFSQRTVEIRPRPKQ